VAEAILSSAKLAVLAPDGLGCFAWGLWRGEMPFLNDLYEHHSITLRSVLPSITPVNFAAMVTGTDALGHGVQSKEDPFGCETIFDVLRQAGKLSAAVGLNDYTGARLLGRATDISGNAGSGDDVDVVDCIAAIAVDLTPEFIIAQLGRVDDVFPMIFFVMKKQRHLVIVILLAVSLASRYYVGQEGIPFVDTTFFEDVKSWFYRRYGFMPGRPGDWFPPCRVFEFGLGVYLALLLPRARWFAFQTRFSQPIQFLSDLAFPLFLIHYPFLFLVIYLGEIGLPPALSIVAFLAIITFVSYLVNLIDQRVPRKRIISLLNNNRASNQ
jgi:hypothetical protein